MENIWEPHSVVPQHSSCAIIGGSEPGRTCDVNCNESAIGAVCNGAKREVHCVLPVIFEYWVPNSGTLSDHI